MNLYENDRFRLIYLRWHFRRSIVGWVILFCRTPRFAFRLLYHRLMWTVARHFVGPLLTPTGILLTDPMELISYWEMFIEGQLLTPRLIRDLKGCASPIVVDVGANVGLFGHLVSNTNPQSRIFAVEPVGEHVRRGLDLQSQSKQAPLINWNTFAAYSRECESFVRLLGGSSSLIESALTSKRCGALLQPVRCRTLDQVFSELPRILILKIDVEGMECHVLRGAGRLLARSAYVIVEALETSSLRAIEKLLTPEHWKCERIGARDFLFSQYAN